MLLSDPFARRYLGGPVPASQHEVRIAEYLRTGAVWIVEAGQPLGLVFFERHGAAYELSY